MTLAREVQKGVADFTNIIGLFLYYGGAASLFTMAVVGTVACDIVILSALIKKADRQSNNISFTTGFLWGSMFANREAANPVVALVISPITTAAAIGLSICLGVPGVGIALAAGWLAASLLFLSGVLTLKLADALQPSVDNPSSDYGLGSTAKWVDPLKSSCHI